MQLSCRIPLPSQLLVSLPPSLIHKLALNPPPPLNPQLHRREPPITPMIMPLVPRLPPNPRSLQALLIAQQRQQAEDDRHIVIELQPHEPVARRVCNVLKVHRLALDQHANRDDGVERGCGCLGCGGERGQV